MDFKEFLSVIDGNPIICEDFAQRDAVMDYFESNGVLGDYTLRADMHTSEDKWLYPFYDHSDHEVHAYGQVYSPEPDWIPFDAIAPWVVGEDYSFVAPCLDGLFD